MFNACPFFILDCWKVFTCHYLEKHINSKTFSVGKARRPVTAGCACARACIRAKGPRLVAKRAAHEVVLHGVDPGLRRHLRRDVQRVAAMGKPSVPVHEAHHLGGPGIVIIITYVYIYIYSV